jgi:hypothetical protein
MRNWLVAERIAGRSPVAGKENCRSLGVAPNEVGLRPSFSAQVRFGEPGAPVYFLSDY